MRPHTIENIMYRITHIQSLVHIEVLLLIQWEDDSQYESSFGPVTPSPGPIELLPLVVGCWLVG